ncbi:hypothetical protein [Ureibacillus sp. FSL W8-0352]|uniref:hypothetical protein n=1 Tax=Ureibacillus sp. FSL W8-0352 TaxID=2954596 RepID=UPI0030FA4104
MNFSDEMKGKIKQFAKEQSQYYLEEAEMTYLEKLKYKTGQIRSRVTSKLSKLKSQSNMSMEAQNDMILYMKDLIEEGLSEQEAFERRRKH